MEKHCAAPYDEEPRFVCRPYLKVELAQLYAPHSTPQTALQQLYRWIRQHPQLWPELQALGSPRQRHSFLRKEVELIIHHLGEP